MIESLRQGDHAAFEEIYKRYWAPLYSYLYNRLHARVRCEEIVQEVFLNLWMKRNDELKIVSLSAYLFAGAKYRMLNEIKGDHVRVKYAADFSAFIQNKQSHCTEEAIAEGDLVEALQSTVSQLPPKCRRIFELSRNHHQSISDISLSLNLSHKTVENQLSKALKILRLRLGEFLCIISYLSWHGMHNAIMLMTSSI